MLRLTTSLLALALASPLQAQTPRDWDLVVDPSKKLTVAYSEFDSGLAVLFRCMDGSFAAMISGLPANLQERRTLKMQFGEEEAHDTSWTTTTDATVVVGDYPAPLARDFRQGGSLRVTIPRGAPDGRNLQHVVELPPSHSAIDEVLTTCSKPLTDPRDAELEAIGEESMTGGMTWARRPDPTYPRRGYRYRGGQAVTSCLTSSDGTLRDCRTEMEHPEDAGFGAAALDAVRRARVRSTETPDQPIPVRTIGFLTRFRSG